jgi:hypothetical protein
MTNYETLWARAKEHFARYDVFERRGKDAVGTALKGLVEYLGAPAGKYRFGPAGTSLTSDTLHPLFELAELQDDGWFAACLLLYAEPVIAGTLRFTIFVRVDEDSTVFRAGTGKEFRVTDLQGDSLFPFYEECLRGVLLYFQTSPERLARGEVQSPIGFIQS